MPDLPTSVNPPRQARSRATLDRILEAAEALLETQLMDEISLSDVLERAGVSVGAFYGRFRNKEALLPELHTRYARRLDVESVRVLAPERWRGRPLARRIGLLVRYAVFVYRRQRGLLRALSLDWRIHPERVTPSVLENREQFHRRLAAALAGDGDEISHPEADAAVRFALTMLGAVCRDQMLSSPTRHPHPIDAGAAESWLAAELERALLAYLTAPPGLVRAVPPPSVPSPDTQDATR